MNLKIKVLSFILASVVALPVVSFVKPSAIFVKAENTTVEKVGKISGTCGEKLQWTLDEEGTFTISGSGCMYDYENYTNETPWNEYRDSIKTVIIGGSVTSIGNNAFSNCLSLASVTFGDSVKSIGDFAFYGCISLSPITIPETVTSIGSNAFSHCNALKSITLPESVKSIGDEAFSWCDTLSSVMIPNSVTSIGNRLFYYCPELVSVTIPDSVKSIGVSMFCGCSSLTSITIPDSVISIDSYAFYLCDSLTDVYYMGTEEMWNKITVEDLNEPLLNATVHFESKTEVIVKDDKYTIKDGIIDGISNNVTVSSLSDIILNDNFTVIDAKGNLLSDNDIIGTGCVISIFSGDTVTVVVKGDTDGDGNITSTDYLLVKNAFLGKAELKKAFSLSADTDCNGEVDSSDFAKLKSHFLGEYNLFS